MASFDLTRAALVTSAAAAVVLLGPGAFSVDARLFGRREIVIAPDRHASALGKRERNV
jgi:hypothetical protein